MRDILVNNDIDGNVTQVTQVLYDCVKNSRCQTHEENVNTNQDRWERLLNDKDDRRIWKAVNCKGEFKESNEVKNKPADQEFKTFFVGSVNHIPSQLTDKWYCK